jgi:hypothetical protein
LRNIIIHIIVSDVFYIYKVLFLAAMDGGVVINFATIFRITFRCMRWFGGPDKRLCSKRRADKLCRSNGVGMFPSYAGARSETIAAAEAEGPLGPVRLAEQVCACFQVFILFVFLILYQ